MLSITQGLPARPPTPPTVVLRRPTFRLGTAKLVPPPELVTFGDKVTGLLRKVVTVDGADDTINGVANALPASVQPIALTAGQAVGAGVVGLAAVSATRNSLDKFEAYRQLRLAMVEQQRQIIGSLRNDEQTPRATMRELRRLSKDCAASLEATRWGLEKSKATFDHSNFKRLSQRFAEVARGALTATTTPGVVHRVIEYERAEALRSIANFERAASVGNAAAMIGMATALVTGTGQSAADIVVQHTAKHTTAHVGGTLAAHGLDIATNGVFAAGQLVQTLFGASRVLTGTQCRRMLRNELTALAHLEGTVDAATYDCLRQTVERLLELNEQIYIKSGAKLSLGQALMLGGSIASLVGGAASLGAASVPATALSVAGTVLTIAGVTDQVRGEIKRGKFLGSDASQETRDDIERRQLANMLDRLGLAPAVDEVGRQLEAYQNGIVKLKALSMSGKALKAETRRLRPHAATAEARADDWHKTVAGYNALGKWSRLAHRTTLLPSDKGRLTEARRALGDGFFEGSREDVERRIHDAMRAMPGVDAMARKPAFERVVLYKTLARLRSSTDPEVRQFLFLESGRKTRPIAFADLEALAARRPRVRAEYIRQFNQLMLPALRADAKALRADSAQRLIRLAEVMAEMNRLFEPTQVRPDPLDDVERWLTDVPAGGPMNESGGDGRDDIGGIGGIGGVGGVGGIGGVGDIADIDERLRRTASTGSGTSGRSARSGASLSSVSTPASRRDSTLDLPQAFRLPGHGIFTRL